jgi:6-phosphogluconolactonase
MLATALLLSSLQLAAGGQPLVYVGTYTADGSPNTTAKGIYAYRFHPATGKLTPLGMVAETPSPAFLAVHPNRRYLYAANEHDNTVSAFAIDRRTGKLAFLNQVSSRGEGPAHLVVDKSGKSALVGNYRGGGVALLPILKDGKLGEATAFDQHRQARGVAFSPDNRFALMAEHGIDHVVIYKFAAAKGTLTPADPPFWKASPGLAPRHMVFHPRGEYLYVLDELASAVTVLSYEAVVGAMQEIQSMSTLPPGFAGQNTTPEIHVDRAGRFLYASNRGHDSIAVFSIDLAWGMLGLIETVPTGGKRPRSFSLDPSGSYLFAANQDSNNIVIFRIDPNSGRLTPTGQLIESPTPVCVLFVP